MLEIDGFKGKITLQYILEFQLIFSFYLELTILFRENGSTAQIANYAWDIVLILCSHSCRNPNASLKIEVQNLYQR